MCELSWPLRHFLSTTSQDNCDKARRHHGDTLTDESINKRRRVSLIGVTRAQLAMVVAAANIYCATVTDKDCVIASTAMRTIAFPARPATTCGPYTRCVVCPKPS